HHYIHSIISTIATSFYSFFNSPVIQQYLHSFPTRRSSDLSTMKSRRGFAIQRLMNAMRQAHADGWFIVFDTLTLADDRLEAFYDNPNALRDYFRDIGRMVLAAEGRKANDSHA